MSKPTPEERYRSAMDQIYWYDKEIKHHDNEASRLRQVRQRYKAQRDRALVAMERERNAAMYTAKQEKQ